MTRELALKKGQFYLDVNATYGILPEIWPNLEESLRSSSNPSSVHLPGQNARNLIENARAELLKFIDAKENSRLIFTSGATEANNLAILSLFESERHLDVVTNGYQLVLSALEHPSVLEAAHSLERRGIKIAYVYPQRGNLKSEDFLKFVSDDTKLVSLMLANNETGEIFPVEKIAKEIKKQYPRVLIHSDAVQALGKMKFSFDELGVDMLSISGHKLGALPGIGALIIKKQIDLVPLTKGGPQELRFRAGTENLPGILSFSYVANKISKDIDTRIEKMKLSSTVLKERLVELAPYLVFHNEEYTSLVNTLSMRVPGVRADDLVVALDLQGIYVSSGAACASGKQEPSHVLLAMGFTQEETKETIRISLGDVYCQDEMVEAAEKIASVINQVRFSLGQAVNG